MKILLVPVIIMLLQCGCYRKPSTAGERQLSPVDLVNFVLGKTIREVADSLNWETSNLHFTDEPPRIFISGRYIYPQKGSLLFYFDRISFVNDTTFTSEGYLRKTGNKVITAAEWLDSSGARIYFRKDR